MQSNHPTSLSNPNLYRFLGIRLNIRDDFLTRSIMFFSRFLPVANVEGPVANVRGEGMGGGGVD